MHVRDTVQGLLRQFIKEKYPMKSEPETNKCIEDITTDKHPIDSQYWTKIIERMYDDKDVYILKPRIKDVSKNLMKEEIQKQLNGC